MGHSTRRRRHSPSDNRPHSAAEIITQLLASANHSNHRNHDKARQQHAQHAQHIQSRLTEAVADDDDDDLAENLAYADDGARKTQLARRQVVARLEPLTCTCHIVTPRNAT